MVIYKTTNLETGKIYIGKDKHNNPQYLGSGVKLKDAIRAYGKDKFSKTILEYCSSYEEMNTREKYWIEFYNSTNPIIGYNISFGGDGGDNFTNHPNKEEYRNKLSETSRKSNMKLRDKLSEISKSLWKNEEYKNNVILGLSDYWKNNDNKEKFSNKMKEVLKDPKNKKIWSDCKKGDKNKRWLGFAYLYDKDGSLIERYDKVSTAKIKLKINFADMNKIRRGERDIILTSSSKSKSKFEGCRLVISKV